MMPSVRLKKKNPALEKEKEIPVIPAAGPLISVARNKAFENLRLKSIGLIIEQEDAEKAILALCAEFKTNESFKAQVKQLQKETLIRREPGLDTSKMWEYSYGRWYVSLQEKRILGATGVGRTTIHYDGILYCDDKTWKAKIRIAGVS